MDLLVTEHALAPADRAALLAELQAAAGHAAEVTGVGMGGAVHAHVRKATRIAVAPETRARVAAAFQARTAEIAAHFGVEVSTCEEPQFLRYTEGDYFVAHQDGNTPLIHDDTRHRRVSAVLFLSRPADAPAPDTYGGGALVFHAPPHQYEPPTTAPAAPGTLVAFRSETTHEVTPVTHGERYTVVTWYR